MTKRTCALAAIVLASLAISANAHAEKRRLSGMGREVAEPVKTTPFTRANPKREIVQRVATFLFTSTSPDWDGVTETSPQQWIQLGDFAHALGHFAFHHKNGDESYGWFQDTGKEIQKPDGSWEATFEGQKTFLGGTGKFANIKGVIKYKGKADPSGSTFQWEADLDY